jgi:hypothetical protein
MAGRQDDLGGLTAMTDREGTAYMFAIVGVSAALVVTLIAAGTIAALGHAVPKELWAIGGALSGALVGILVPSPNLAVGKEATPSAAAYKTHNAAVQGARRRAEEIQAAGALPEVTAAAKDALLQVEQLRGNLKTPLAALARATAAKEDGQAHTAAAAAVDLQRGALAQAKGWVAERAAAGAPEDPRLKAVVEVHEAAHEAASKAAPAAAQRAVGWFAAVKTITAEAKIFVPLLVFTVALALGVLLGLGVIHAQPCPKEAKSCAYYASTTKQAANALIALASAAGGAALGVFATSPGGKKT